MKVFSNHIIVLDFDPATSYKDKVTWRKKITDNGGVISYILTKKAAFYVVFKKSGCSVSFKLRQCDRYNIPVVSPKFVEQCLLKERLVDTEPYKLKDINNNNEGLQIGKIQSARGTGSVVKKRRIRKVNVNLTAHSTWKYGDVNAPPYDEDGFELPKWALLTDQKMTRLQCLEVHVSRSDDLECKFRLYAQSGTFVDQTVASEDAVVWFFSSLAEAMSGYDQLYKQYTSKPVAMVICKPGAVENGGLGSTKLRIVLGKLSLMSAEVSPQVAALTGHIWNEALQEVDMILETPMKYVQEKQVTEARVVLSQMTELFTSGGNQGDTIQKLCSEFYDILPHTEEHKTDYWTLKDVIVKQDLCQLLMDIISVSEATDWSSNSSDLAKYRALGCHITHVNQSSVDFAQIQEVMSSVLQLGGKVCNVFRVRRTEEEVNFLAEFGNMKTLTHCSASYNCLGILSRGLLLPSQVTDKLGVSRTDAGNLGPGIYFSDSARKSATYSSCSVSTGTRLMLVCDVALGKVHVTTETCPNVMGPPEDADSIQGMKSSTDTKGAFLENEFAIFRPSQQCIKYLVEFTMPEDDIKPIDGPPHSSTMVANDERGSNGTQSNKSQPNKEMVSKGKEHKGKTSEKKDQATLTKIDISDVKDIVDPLSKVKAGLHGNKTEHIPLKSVHIRARMMDMVAKVVVLQAYRNDNTHAIEAKYVFPLDDTAAVCGFEAFINGKHIIGRVQEKAAARKEYREAVARGDGAYLMEEETPDVFSVSVGNLPPNSDVLIKITYIAELSVQGEAICLNMPATVAPWLQDSVLAHKTQSSTKSVNVTSTKWSSFSLMVAVNMPFDIRQIVSPTHIIRYKKTATNAVVNLPKRSDIQEGFQLQVYLAHVHVPRMWVETHPENHTQACMLTFYPEFEAEALQEPEITVALDMSNSMKGKAEAQAKKVCLLLLDHLPSHCVFNVMVFGSSYRELFPAAQKFDKSTQQAAIEFIQESTSDMGATEFWDPLHCMQILSSADSHLRSLFFISDGHVTQESLVVTATRKSSQKIRVFTMGVSSTANQHLLRSLASISGGCYQYYNNDTKSQWQSKLIGQVEKACQPGLCNVHVDWLQTDENAESPVQAPNQIPSVFNGSRQVVYGFVNNCMQATLRASIEGQDISTMVSTVDLNVTKGIMLHQLAARAVITDYETGILDEDKIKHQVLKTEKKAFVIELSKKYSIVTPYTSFIAVEDRSQATDVVSIPTIEELVNHESVDILPYIDWEQGAEDTQLSQDEQVKALLQRAAVEESYSVRQAVDTYAELAGYLDHITNDIQTAKLVYERVEKLHQSNPTDCLGDIVAKLQPFIQDYDKMKMLAENYIDLHDLPLQTKVRRRRSRCLKKVDKFSPAPCGRTQHIVREQERQSPLKSLEQMLPSMELAEPNGLVIQPSSLWETNQSVSTSMLPEKTEEYPIDYSTAIFDPKSHSIRGKAEKPPPKDRTPSLVEAQREDLPMNLTNFQIESMSYPSAILEYAPDNASSVSYENAPVRTSEEWPLDIKRKKVIPHQKEKISMFPHSTNYLKHAERFYSQDEIDKMLPDVNVQNTLAHKENADSHDTGLLSIKLLENCALQPPEITISPEHISEKEVQLQQMANIPLPDEDDELLDYDDVECSLEPLDSTSQNDSQTSRSYSQTSPVYLPASLRNKLLKHNPLMSQEYQQLAPSSSLAAQTTQDYSPTSPIYSPKSPSYSPTTPTYSPTAPTYSPTSPTYSPLAPTYSPTAPTYSPTIPAYSCTTPSYSRMAYFSAIPAYSPTAPDIYHTSNVPTPPTWSTSSTYAPADCQTGPLYGNRMETQQMAIQKKASLLYAMQRKGGNEAPSEKLDQNFSEQRNHLLQDLFSTAKSVKPTNISQMKPHGSIPIPRTKIITRGRREKTELDGKTLDKIAAHIESTVGSSSVKQLPRGRKPIPHKELSTKGARKAESNMEKERSRDRPVEESRWGGKGRRSRSHDRSYRSSRSCDRSYRRSRSRDRSYRRSRSRDRSYRRSRSHDRSYRRSRSKAKFTRSRSKDISRRQNKSKAYTRRRNRSKDKLDGKSRSMDKSDIERRERFLSKICAWDTPSGFFMSDEDDNEDDKIEEFSIKSSSSSNDDSDGSSMNLDENERNRSGSSLDTGGDVQMKHVKPMQGSLAEGTKLVRDPLTGRWGRVPLVSVDTTEKKSLETEDWLWSGVQKASDGASLLAERHSVDTLQNILFPLVKKERCYTQLTHMYWDLTDELCDILNVSKGRIIAILERQGINSLGPTVKLSAYRVIATLMVIIYAVQQAWIRQNSLIPKHTNHFPKSINSSMDIKVNFDDKISHYSIVLDGCSVGMSTFFDPAFYWLKLMDRKLPPLYNMLELGKNRMEFLRGLVKIFTRV